MHPYDLMFVVFRAALVILGFCYAIKFVGAAAIVMERGFAQ